MKRIESLIKKIEKWDGQDVRDLQPVANEFLDAIEDEDQFTREDYVDEIRNICGGASSGLHLWPSDMNDTSACEFLAVDHTGAYLFRDGTDNNRWFIGQIYDEDNEAAEG